MTHRTRYRNLPYIGRHIKKAPFTLVKLRVGRGYWIPAGVSLTWEWWEISDISWGFDESGGISNISWSSTLVNMKWISNMRWNQMGYRVSVVISNISSDIAWGGISNISWSSILEDIGYQLEFRSCADGRGVSNMRWSQLGYPISAGVRSWGISDISWSFIPAGYRILAGFFALVKVEGDIKYELKSVGISNISWSSFLGDMGYQLDFALLWKWKGISNMSWNQVGYRMSVVISSGRGYRLSAEFRSCADGRGYQIWAGVSWDIEYHQLEFVLGGYRLSAGVSLPNISQIFTLAKKEVDTKFELESAGISNTS